MPTVNTTGTGKWPNREQPVLPLEQMGQGDDDHQLGQLGGLEAETGDRQPARAPPMTGPTASTATSRATVTRKPGMASLDRPGRDATRDEQGHGPDPDADELALEEVEAVLGLVDPDRRRSRQGGAQPDDNQDHGQDEQSSRGAVVHLEPLGPAAGRRPDLRIDVTFAVIRTLPPP